MEYLNKSSRGGSFATERERLESTHILPQDGAQAYNVVPGLDYLSKAFSGRWIGQNSYMT
jgi:hypothetical protein